MGAGATSRIMIMAASSHFTSRLFLSGSVGFVLIGGLVASYGAALPAFARNFSITTEEASLILTAQMAAAVLTILAGTMGLRGLTARRSALLMLAGSLLMAAGINWPLTLLGGVFAGAGFGITATYVNRAFLDGFGGKGPAMVGLVNAISALGLIAAPLWFLAAGSSPLWLYGTLAVLSAVTLALYPAKADSFAGAASGLPPLGPRSLGIIALNFVSGVIETGLNGLGIAALITLGWAESRATQMLSGFFVAFLLARLSLYWVSQWVAPAHMFLIACAGTAACVALAACGFEGIGYVLSGAFVGFAFPSFYVWSVDLLGPDPRMSSSVMLAGLMGGSLAPLILQAVLAPFGLQYLFVAVAVIAGLLSLVALALVRRQARRS